MSKFPIDNNLAKTKDCQLKSSFLSTRLLILIISPSSFSTSITHFAITAEPNPINVKGADIIPLIWLH